MVISCSKNRSSLQYEFYQVQHYFFKKQPLPVVESVEEEDDPGVAVENAPSSSEDEENTVEESEEKAGLRERVKNALNELER